jgi:WD40 repeat protein
VGSLVRTPADSQSRFAFVVRAVPSGRRVGAIPIPSLRASRGVTVGLHGARVAMRVSPEGMVIVRDLGDPTRADTLRDRARSDGRYLGDAVAFSPDGRVLAWQGSARAVLLWDVAARQVVDSLLGFVQDPQAIVFSGDGRVIAVAEPNALRFWRRGSPRPFASIARLGVPGGSEATLALDADGTLVAYVGQEGAMLLADVARAEVLGPVNTARGAPVSHVAFTDAGRRLVVVSEDGAVAYVDMTPARWAERACAIAWSDRTRDRWPARTTGAPFPVRCPTVRPAPATLR